MGATVAFVNGKGGVGKTTAVLGFASAAWAAGQRALVVDLDPQASASWVLGIDPGTVEVSSAEVLASGRPATARSAVVPSEWGEGVDVLPASPRLQHRDGSGSNGGRGSTSRLRSALGPLASEYDIVLVDCAPALGPLTVSALVAATHALIVVEPAALGLRGLAAAADAIDAVWEHDNPHLDLAGVILNRVPAVSAEAERRADELARIVGRRAIWSPPVPQRVVLTQASAERCPIHGLGWKAADVAAVFDQLYARLRRTVRRGTSISSA